VGDLDLPVMVRHKRTVEAQTAIATQELERLRQMEEQIERQKRELEEARRKQNDYEKGRQELLDHLTRSLVTLERQEIKAEQLAEVLRNTRLRFKEMQAQIAAIREDGWTDQNVREEIGKALAFVDEARLEYNKTMARVEGALAVREEGGGAGKPVIFEESAGRSDTERTFGQWVLVGLAVSLPVLVALLVLGVLVTLYSTGVL
jgi:hypothetical protein